MTYIPPVAIQTNIPSIYQRLADYFPVGAEIDSTDLTGPHAQLMAKHFNSIVSGNDMKRDATEDGKTSFSASNPADVALFTRRIQNHIKGVV